MKDKLIQPFAPALLTIAFLGSGGWITLAGTGFNPTLKGTEFIRNLQAKASIHQIKTGCFRIYTMKIKNDVHHSVTPLPGRFFGQNPSIVPLSSCGWGQCATRADCTRGSDPMLDCEYKTVIGCKTKVCQGGPCQKTNDCMTGLRCVEGHCQRSSGGGGWPPVYKGTKQ